MSRRKVLRRAKGIFEAMEEARRARRDEDGEYDSDDSEYMYKVLGMQKKKKRRSMEEFLMEKAMAVFDWVKLRATRLPSDIWVSAGEGDEAPTARRWTRRTIPKRRRRRRSTRRTPATSFRRCST